MNRMALVPAVLACTAMAACAALSSSSEPSEGIPYFLPKTLVRYAVDQSDPAKSNITRIEEREAGPRYLAYNANALSDENVCIDRTSTGLLKKVYFGAQDRTADIILNLIELAAQGSNDAVGRAGEQPPTPGKCTGVVVSEWMDPFDAAAVERFNSRLCRLKVEVPSSVGFAGERVSCPTDAVCFATQSTMNAYLTSPDGTIAHTFNPEEVTSGRDVGWIKVRRAFFNKRITQLDFEQGVLTTLRIRKDSEILGLSEMPLKAIERVLAIPGNAIGMAFGSYQERLVYLQRRKALSDAGAVRGEPQITDSAVTAVLTACASGQETK